MFFRLDTLELSKAGAGNTMNGFACRIGNEMEMYADRPDSLASTATLKHAALDTTEYET